MLNGRARRHLCACITNASLLTRFAPPPAAQALLVRDEEFAVRAQLEVQLCQDCDRVALLLWLTQKGTGQHVVVANTHLTFPHSEADRQLQLRQVRLSSRTKAPAAGWLLLPVGPQRHTR